MKTLPSRFKAFAIFLLLALALSGCVKEKEVFEVNEFHVQQEGSSKAALKTPAELISIAFFDIFGAQIPAQILNAYLVAYESLGDKDVILERVVLNFLNFPDVQLPTISAMHADLPSFVNETYKKFYARNPTDFERTFLVNYLKENPDVTSKQVYQAFLTSQEYLYY